MASAVLIDARLDDIDVLLAGIAPSAVVFIVPCNEDGIDFLRRQLHPTTRAFDALHVLCHGSDGRLLLGDASIDIEQLDRHRAALAEVGNALHEHGGIHLYGCEVARSDTGRRFIESLAAYVDRPVAASASKIGAAELGGRWTLETATSPMALEPIVGACAQAQYAHVLTAPNPLALSTLNGTNGFQVEGEFANDSFGGSVSVAGDVNGDGFDDLIIGARFADPHGNSSGSSYVVFGKAEGFSAAVAVSALDGSNGFQIDGVNANDYAGAVVSGAGDLNGDGYDDLLVGAPGADPNGLATGSTYVIFGKADGFSATLALSALDGSNGFRLDGVTSPDQSGSAVNAAGDVNGDGFDDLIIGARFADPHGNSSGSSYVVFGRSSAFGATLALSTLNGTNGFRIDGVAANDSSGVSVGSAGDINGDGYDDLVIGAVLADPNGNADAGSSYVVFGTGDRFAATFALSLLNGSNGFRLDGVGANDFAGNAVSSAGDINGDGYDDLIVGAYSANPGGNITAGSSYVVFGRASGFGATFALSSLNGNNGFRIDGVATSELSGNSVSAAGDLNGDGFDDLLIGARLAASNGNASGSTYVVFGQAGGFGSTLALSTLNGTNGFRIDGSAAGNFSGASVSGGGDINGDGFDDLVIGAPYTSPGGRSQAGSGYVVFGGDFTTSVTHLGTNDDDELTGTGGAERFVAGRGNDILTTGGGADVVLAAEGDDLIRIADLAFARIDGGSGIDTLALTGANLTLDLTTLADNRLHDVEIIDLTGIGNNTLILDRLELLQTSERTHTLRIDGNTGDVVERDIGWVGAGTRIGEAQTYAIYTRGNATLEIDTDITVRTTSLSLSSLDGTNGFKLSGGAASDQAGFSVNGAGDINGDGFDDVIVGARNTGQSGASSGTAYVVFGKATGFVADVDLNALNGSNGGFKLTSEAGHNWAGRGVSLAGDVNGDGLDDLLIGAGIADANGVDSGAAYVVFGKTTGLTNLNLGSLNGTTGFRLAGAAAGEQAGVAVCHVGDVNGDGFDDIVIGARVADVNGTDAGAAYVVFGKTSGFANISLGAVNGTTGFRLIGAAAGEQTGYAVAGAGDVNGDGFDDVIIGAPFADVNGTDAGAAYVVFGKAGAFASSISLSTLNGTNGFRLTGGATGDRAGLSVQSAGDINHDGYDDIVIGAYQLDAPPGANAGAAFVVFGKASGFSDITLAPGSFDGTNGFVLAGAAAGDEAGISASGIGDFNGDGYGDLLIGARRTDGAGVDAGTAYVVYGKASGFAATIDLGSIGGLTGLALKGVAAGDYAGFSVRGAGDINGDGFDDLIVGATAGDGNAVNSGTAYVVFGGQITGLAAFMVGTVSDTLIGTAGDDTLTGTSASERFLGGTGNDTLDGGGGDDHLDGGAGNDTYIVDSLSDVIVDDTGTDTVRSTVNFTLPDFLENLILTGAAHSSAVGNAGENVLTGNTGNNPMRGNGGDDQLYGAQGYDTALFSGASSQYAFVSYLGAIHVADRIPGRDGVDDTFDVEQAFFDADNVTAVFTASDVFSPLEYIASYADLIAGFGVNAALGYQHFVDTGRFALRTAAFDGLEYLASQPDLLAGLGMDADAGAAHYIQSGRNEGRTVTFNGLEYIASYNDLINSFGVNEDLGTSHYLASGRFEGRAVSFRGLEYLASNTDLMAGFGTNFELATIHYIQSGRFEGRNADFNGLEYIASYADLIQGIGANRDAGTLHYINAGRFEGRTVSFDPAQYLANYADLAAGFGNNHDLATLHYIQHGFSEGRTDQPL